MTNFANDFFVCYASIDGGDAARAIVLDLESRGVSCWIAPRNIPLGFTWPKAIVSGIESSRCMLLVITRGANDSEEVEKEVALAAHLRKFIFPVRAENIQLSGSLLYQLQARQWRDLFIDRDSVINEMVAQLKSVQSLPPAINRQAPFQSPRLDAHQPVEINQTVEKSSSFEGPAQRSAVHQPQITTSSPAPASPQVELVEADDRTVGINGPMHTAGKVLLMFGRLQCSKSRMVEALDCLGEAIERFEADARAAGASAGEVSDAKYALASTADDLVQNLLSENDQNWIQNSLLKRFFDEPIGGARFFSILEDAKKNPTTNRGLLEIFYACLSLGFEGLYRTSQGEETLRRIRRDLYERISRARPLPLEDFSPHWLGQNIPLITNRLQVPVWPVAAMVGVILLGSYLYLRNTLSGQAEALALKMEQIHPKSELSIARESLVLPPPDPQPRTSTQLQRIRAALAKEILALQLDVAQSATTIYIRMGDSVLFPLGGAKVSDSFQPIADKIAAALDREPGPIHVDGYTDSDPIHTVSFPSTFELSEARAKSLASMLKSGLSQPDRLVVSGKGADNPIAPNDTESDKSRNRRVELSIPRAD